MPSNFEKLRAPEVEELLDRISYFYGTDASHLKKFHFYKLKKGHIHISTIDVEKFWPDRLNTIGLYFGMMHDEDRFRLSFEGSRFLTATKNYVKLNKETLTSYVAGENLFKEEVEEINSDNNCPFLIVVCNGENLGSCNVKDGYVLNYLSKGRKLDFNKLF